MSAVAPPVIVLVRPQLAENIGKAARAMLNFGLTELRLVSPRDGWPNPQAGPAASGADAVLTDARLFADVADAVADCAHVYATTVRRRGVSKPVVTPEQAGRAIHAASGRSAILFGPERSGLDTDDVALARTILTVPINPAFGSLNLAQAVILVAYEWSRGEALAQPPAVAADPPAPQIELEGMIAQLDTMLIDAGFYFPADRAPTVRRTCAPCSPSPAGPRRRCARCAASSPHSIARARDGADGAGPTCSARVEPVQFVRDRRLDQPVPPRRHERRRHARGLGVGDGVRDHLPLARLVADLPPLRLDPRGRAHVAEAPAEQRRQLGIDRVDPGADLRHRGACVGIEDVAHGACA